MTFKEKLEKEHPERLDERCSGGCKGCPFDYGYEPMKCEGGNIEECEACWNREIPDTPAPMTAEEVWEIAKRIVLPASDSGSLKASELREIFDSDIETYILKNFTPQEAKAKIDEWESKQIHVGDVIEIEDDVAVVTKIINTAPTITIDAVCKDGNVFCYSDKNFKKTGKHIDIQSVLNQIGKEE